MLYNIIFSNYLMVQNIIKYYKKIIYLSIVNNTIIVY